MSRWIADYYDRGLVSVIIPTYNRSGMLVEAMDSVFAQTYRPIELIVVDDGSTDDTQEVLEHWAREHPDSPSFSLLSIHQANQGAQVARNRGLRESRGEFIQFLDSDDILLPEKMARQVACFKADRAFDVVYGDWVEGCDLAGAPPGSLGQQSDMVVALLSTGWVPTFCYLYRRQQLPADNLWDPTITVNQDLDYALQVAGSGLTFGYARGSDGLYRRHPHDRISQKGVLVRASNMVRILKKLEARLLASGSMTPPRAWALAHQYLVMGREAFTENPQCFREARQQLFRICPTFKPRNWAYRLLVGIAGYEMTQRLWNAARKIRRVNKAGIQYR